MKKLKDIMTTEVQVIPPDCTLREAAQKMKEHDTGALPVCDGERLIGMLTDRDIVVRGLAEKDNPDDIKAKDVMTSKITYCFDDQDVEEAVRLMEIKQIRRLVVVNRGKRLVGIVSLGDVAASAHQELAGAALGQVASQDKKLRSAA